MVEDVPQGAQTAGDEVAKLRALAQRSIQAVQAQRYQFSPLTFLLRALGAVSPPFAQVAAGEELQLLTPRLQGKDNQQRVGTREGVQSISAVSTPLGFGAGNLLELTAVSDGFGGGK